MPRKYARRRRRGKKRKYAATRSKLADKKINTLFEKRAKQIADKAVKDSHEWYTAKWITKDPQFDWAAHGPWLRVPTASCLSLNAATLFHLRLTDLGQILENSLYVPTQASDAVDNQLRISSFRSKFDFRYAGSAPCTIDISMVKVNGSQLLSTQTAIPTISMVQPINDLYEYWPSTMRQNLDFKYQRIAHKRIHMGPGKMFRNAYLPTGQNSATANVAVYNDPQKSVSITKAFKGAGMKLQVENTNRAPQTEVYLLVVADRPIEFTAVTGVRFRLDKATQGAQPGNH